MECGGDGDGGGGGGGGDQLGSWFVFEACRQCHPRDGSLSLLQDETRRALAVVRNCTK